MDGFVSYSHDDYQAFTAFQPHLCAVERAYGLTFWADQRIAAGYDWNSAIQDRIAAADVFVLLLSPAFIASSYIYDKEIPTIRQRRKQTGALVLPLILDRCLWKFICGSLQAMPVEAGRLKPIAEWEHPGHGYHHACLEIGNSLERYYGIPQNPIDWAAP